MCLEVWLWTTCLFHSLPHHEKLEGIFFYRRMGQVCIHYFQKHLTAFTISNFGTMYHTLQIYRITLYSQCKQILPSLSLVLMSFCLYMTTTHKVDFNKASLLLFGRWTSWHGNSQSCPPARRASGSGVLHGIFSFPSCWIRHVINNKYIRPPDAKGIRFC